MRLHKHTLSAALAVAASCGLLLSIANAQQSPQGSNDGNASNQGEDQQPWLQMNSKGWVRIATDYDDDGKYDAVGTIYLQDLMDAMNLSRERADQEAQRRHTARPNLDDRRRTPSPRPSDSRRSDSRRSAENRESKGQNSFRISGAIAELRTVDFVGTSESSHQVARIRNQEGRTAKALLGPQSQLKKLDLREGDQVAVEGVIGRVNDRTMLLAHHVSSDGQEIEVKQQSSRNIKQVTAEIRGLRPVSFRGFDDRFVVAQVELDNGQEATVHLGALSVIKEAGLSRGDKIQMLARPIRINGKPGLIAEEISFQGEKLESQKTNRSQRRSSGQSRR